MGEDIETRLRHPSGIGEPCDHEAMAEAADTIARLRADLRAALAILQELVNYDNGGSGDGSEILEAAEKILASHKENTPVQSHEEKQG